MIDFLLNATEIEIREWAVYTSCIARSKSDWVCFQMTPDELQKYQTKIKNLESKYDRL